jgi:23S rRNA-/tRNA-specific pseudouridylate synthase
LVNNEKVDVNYELKGHDLITHKVHRHELPVLATPIPIIHSSDEMLVIDKPPSLPVSLNNLFFQSILSDLN